MEEILKQILSKISSIDKRLSSLEYSQINANNQLERFDGNVVQIQTDITELKETTNRIDNNLKHMKEVSADLKSDVIDLNNNMNKGFDKLDDKLDDLQFDLNNLSIKTIKIDNKLILFEKRLKENDQKRG